MIIYQSNHMFF